MRHTGCFAGAILHLAVLMLLLSGASASGQHCPRSNVGKLELLYKALGVPIPAIGSANYQYCHWNGVKCRFAGNQSPAIVGLDFRGRLRPNSRNRNKIVLPKVISCFSKLETLDLSDNGFNTSISPFLTHLPALKTLQIFNASLRGEIPKDLFKLANLSTLDLSRNLLTGHIPLGLASKPKLTTLNLSCNRLTGVVPTVIVNLIPRMAALDLGCNAGLKSPDVTKLRINNRQSLCRSCFSTCVEEEEEEGHHEEEECFPCKKGQLRNLKNVYRQLGLSTQSKYSEHEAEHICDMRRVYCVGSFVELDLSNLGLTKIPKELKCVHAITSIDISYNPLEMIPPLVCELKNLTDLKCEGLSVPSIPSCIFMVGKITNLSLLNTNVIQTFDLAGFRVCHPLHLTLGPEE